MKLRNIFIAGLSALAFTACSDYLEVDAPSKNTHEYVFSDKTEMSRALSGVYTPLMSDNLFGDKVFTAYQLNSDVDFVSNSSSSNGANNYKRFDCDPSGSNINNTWNTLYEGIEMANLFIEGIENSALYNAEDPDADIVQMLGEAKVIRAIYYHELIWMFGDVPFSFNSTKTAESLIYPIKDRAEIIDLLIADIESVADLMKSNVEATIERPSKEMAWGMIARLALTAAGQTLRPDGDTYGKMESMNPGQENKYYKICRDYAKKVITEGTHSLSKPYWKVFYDECNSSTDASDDVMFEIPFGVEETGNIGYIQGVRMNNYDGTTIHNYGKASSSASLNAFYRFMFDADDARRDYVNQLFYYDGKADSNPTLPVTGYVIYNGKWSKLWVTNGLGKTTEGDTGINYPYMRYTDVLLMFAEAENELEGPTDDAQKALEQVRTRAFGSTNPAKITDYKKANHDEFLESVLNERKFEFAGENMRWRDLVRHDLYRINTYYNFFRYLGVAEDQFMASDHTGYVSTYDFGHDEGYSLLPIEYFYVPDVKNEGFVDKAAFPNEDSDLKVCRILNPYVQMTQTEVNALGIPGVVSRNYIMDWINEDTPKNEIHYSFLGYIYSDENDNIKIIENGVAKACVLPSSYPTAQSLPIVRYILPIPNAVIRRSGGAYVNQYGYSK